MGKKTDLYIVQNPQIIEDIGHRMTHDLLPPDIGHKRSSTDEGDIGHKRTATDENTDDIGHKRASDGGPKGDIGHLRASGEDLVVPDIGHRSTIDLKDPHVVTRVSVHRDGEGVIHLILEE